MKQPFDHSALPEERSKTRQVPFRAGHTHEVTPKPKSLVNRIFGSPAWLAFWVMVLVAAYFIWPGPMTEALTGIIKFTRHAITDIAGASPIWQGVVACGFAGLYTFVAGATYNMAGMIANSAYAKVAPYVEPIFRKCNPCHKERETALISDDNHGCCPALRNLCSSTPKTSSRIKVESERHSAKSGWVKAQESCGSALNSIARMFHCTGDRSDPGADESRLTP